MKLYSWVYFSNDLIGKRFWQSYWYNRRNGYDCENVIKNYSNDIVLINRYVIKDFNMTNFINNIYKRTTKW